MKQYPFLNLKETHAAIRGEIDAAMEKVLTHQVFINGPEVGEFECQWAGYCGTKSAVGVANGTVALEALLRCAGIGAGDEVIIPSHTFIATAESVMHAGARPVFADVREDTMLLDPEAVEAAITPRTAGIVAVHLYGMPADMKVLRAIAEKHGLKIFEDAAQAHGAELDGAKAGALSDGAAFSFFPGKNMGAFGDAGAVTTNDEELGRRVRMFVNHGREGKFLHEMEGTNYRLDTLQAAILSVKLKHLEEWNAHRRAVARAYIDRLGQAPFTEVPVGWQAVREGVVSAYHLFVIRVPRRDEVRKALVERGVGTGMHYPVPCHLQPSMSRFSEGKGSLPRTEQICEEIISMPMCPQMALGDVDEVADILAEVLPGVRA